MPPGAFIRGRLAPALGETSGFVSLAIPTGFRAIFFDSTGLGSGTRATPLLPDCVGGSVLAGGCDLPPIFLCGALLTDPGAGRNDFACCPPTLPPAGGGTLLGDVMLPVDGALGVGLRTVIAGPMRVIFPDFRIGPGTLFGIGLRGSTCPAGSRGPVGDCVSGCALGTTVGNVWFGGCGGVCSGGGAWRTICGDCLGDLDSGLGWDNR